MGFLDLWSRVQAGVQNDPRFSDQFKGHIAGMQAPFGMKQGSGFNPFQFARQVLPLSRFATPAQPSGLLGQVGAFKQALQGQGGSPLANVMAQLQAPPGPRPTPLEAPPGPRPAPLDLNAEYERIKAAQGAGAAREWLRTQQG